MGFSEDIALDWQSECDVNSERYKCARDRHRQVTNCRVKIISGNGKKKWKKNIPSIVCSVLEEKMKIMTTLDAARHF